MKRKIALLLAVVMVLSLVPMMSFAASNNSVDKVLSVSDSHVFTGGPTGDAPNLRIEEKYNDEFGGNDQTFRLTLDNAKWTSAMTGTVATDVWATPITDTTVEVIVYDQGTTGNKDVWNIPMLAEVTDKGEVQVTIEPRDSALSGGTYTFANSSSGATVATVGSAKTITRNTSDAASIVIDETNIGAVKVVDTQRFRVRLTRDFEWTSGTTVQFRNMAATPTTGNSSVIVERDGRDLIVEFTRTAGSSVRGSIVINPEIKATKDAKFGDVEATISGLSGDVSSQSNIKIGNYYNYDVEVSIDEVEEFVAGKVDSSEDFTAKLRIKENRAGSLLPGRVIDVELPEGVYLTSHAAIKVTGDIDANGTDNVVIAGGNDITKNDVNSFEIELPSSITKKLDIKLELPLTVEGTFRGDIVATVKGGGVEETEVVIGKAIAPITAEVKVADVKVGVQKQAAPDIIITEEFAGAIREKEYDIKTDKRSGTAYLLVEFKDNYGFYFDGADFEVIEGDLDINEKDAGTFDDGKALRIPIKAESSEASTIKISGITMTLDRTVPEGPFQVDIKGSALVDNTDYDDFTSRIERFDFANVVTPAPGEVSAKGVSLTIGVVPAGGDVAPYINNNRTYAPVSAVAQALGVAKSNIIWNEAARTVTILGNKTVQMTIGSTELLVNGTPVVMDVVPEITNNRTFLPIAWLAKALDVQYAWDAATQTVTFN